MPQRASPQEDLLELGRRIAQEEGLTLPSPPRTNWQAWPQFLRWCLDGLKYLKDRDLDWGGGPYLTRSYPAA